MVLWISNHFLTHSTLLTINYQFYLSFITYNILTASPKKKKQSPFQWLHQVPHAVYLARRSPLQKLSYDFFYIGDLLTKRKCSLAASPHLPPPALPETSPGSSQATAQDLRQARCWGGLGPTGLCCSGPSCPELRGIGAHGGCSWSSRLTLHAPGDGLNKLPVAITLPL